MKYQRMKINYAKGVNQMFKKLLIFILFFQIKINACLIDFDENSFTLEFDPALLILVNNAYQISQLSSVYYKIKSIDAKLACLMYKDDASKKAATRDSKKYYEKSKKLYHSIIDEIELQWFGDPESNILGYYNEAMSETEQLKDERAFYVLKYLNGCGDCLGYIKLMEDTNKVCVPIFINELNKSISECEERINCIKKVINALNLELSDMDDIDKEAINLKFLKNVKIYQDKINKLNEKIFSRMHKKLPDVQAIEKTLYPD